MQIFELTQPRKSRLNEYDPSRSPPGTPNYATGVGPGVSSQRTVTPTPAGQAAPASAPASTPAATPAATTTPNTPTPALTPAHQLARDFWSTPDRTSAAPAAAPNYSAGNYNQTSNAPTANMPATGTPMPSNMQPASAPPATTPNQPTYNAPTASVPATNTVMPTNMSATGAPAATATPTPNPAAMVDPALAAAGTVGLTAAPGRKANIGGAIANAMMKYNANKAGLGFMLPKAPDTEVHVDSTGRITVGGKPYDAKNPEHQRAAGNITISGQPYDPANPQHRAAYLAFKNNAGRGGGGSIKIDQNGVVTVNDQPFDPGNPTHMAAWQQRQQGSPVRATPPAARPAQPARPGQPAQQPPAAPTQQSPAAQTPEQIRIARQRTAATAAQQAMRPTAPTTESLTWSRNFDPSRTLLKKMKSQ